MTDFVPARNFTKADRDDARAICIHTMEASEKPGTARAVAKWFSGPLAPQASAHYCLTPEMRILHADMTWRPIGEVNEGDRLVAADELAGGERGTGGRTYQLALVTRKHVRHTECLRIECADGRAVICSRDHRWLGRRPRAAAWEWLDAAWLQAGHTLCAPLLPWQQRHDRDAGYMEGILDGEGTWSAANEISFAQKEGVVLARAQQILSTWGIPFRSHLRKESGVVVVTLSGVEATMRALGEAGSSRLAQKERWIGRSLRSRNYDNALKIASVEPVGTKEVVSLETSTRTFFAEGILSHNCVDAVEVIQCVKETDVAWAAPGLNRDGIHIEHAGYAHQTFADWSDGYSMAMLWLSAKLTAGICRRYGIPVVKLTVEQVADGKSRGICGHADVTAAFKKSTHTDPGPSFPWAEYLGMVQDELDQLTPTDPAPPPIAEDEPTGAPV